MYPNTNCGYKITCTLSFVTTSNNINNFTRQGLIRRLSRFISNHGSDVFILIYWKRWQWTRSMFRCLVHRILNELRKTGVTLSRSSATTSKYQDNCSNKQQIKTFAILSSRRYRRKNGMATFETIKFDNSALRCLPIDSDEENYVRQVPGACFSRVKPTPVENPVMVAYSPSAMELLDLGEDQLERPEAVDFFSGNAILKGSETAAHCYCGHQFGHFSGQLGDGAAM